MVSCLRAFVASWRPKASRDLLADSGTTLETAVLKRLFHINENRTTIRTELLAGVTTFLAMAYIP